MLQAEPISLLRFVQKSIISMNEQAISKQFFLLINFVKQLQKQLMRLAFLVDLAVRQFSIRQLVIDEQMRVDSFRSKSQLYYYLFIIQVYNKIQILNQQMALLSSFAIAVVIIGSLLSVVAGYTNPNTCTSSQFYEILSLDCKSCPGSTTPSSVDFTYCNCTTPTYDNPEVIGFNDSLACTGSISYTTSQVMSVYGVDGVVSATAVTCSNSYANDIKSKCIPCGNDMTYDTTLESCVCNAANTYSFGGACYQSTSSFTNTKATTQKYDYLVEQNGAVGCQQLNLAESCQMLLNSCVYYNYAESHSSCQRVSSLEVTKSSTSKLPTYTFSGVISNPIEIYASSALGTNSTTVKNQLNFVLVEYTMNGSINDIKPMDSSIFPCVLSDEDINHFQSFGLYLVRTCSNLVTFDRQYFYDLYVVDASGAYEEVPVYLSDLGKYVKRFSPGYYNSITMTLTTQPPLLVPLLTLSTRQSPQVRTISISSDTEINYTPFFAIFLAGTFVILFLHFFRYMKYNPDENNDPYYCFKGILLFFMYAIKYIAVGLWIWILCFSGYIFAFYKFQQTVFIMLPEQSVGYEDLYKPFQAFFWTNFALTIVAFVILLFDLTTSTDFFLIDWQKEKQIGRFDVVTNKKQASVWRKVLLVNELYELSVARTISVELVSFFSLVFLAGLNWINLNYLIPNISDVSSDASSSTNPILSYFIITFVIFISASLQFILRHAVKIWFPLPVENFVDLCSVSNVSIIIFDQALHGYYIHGVNPLGRSEGNLTYIESMFEKQAKAFGKSRAFKIDDQDQCQTFEVIFPFEIRQSFQVKYKSRYLQKLAGRNYATGVLSNPIPDQLSQQDYKDIDQINTNMLESFKYYLQGVKTTSMNVRERTFFQKIINCPIDMTNSKLPIFIKDYWNQFNNVFLNGHEFFLLFNFINFVNAFYVGIGNIYMAFFLAFIVEKGFMFAAGFFIKRNISKNTLIDDKFFN